MGLNTLGKVSVYLHLDEDYLVYCKHQDGVCKVLVHSGPDPENSIDG